MPGDFLCGLIDEGLDDRRASSHHLRGRMRFFATGGPLWHSKGGVCDRINDKLWENGVARCAGSVPVRRCWCGSSASHRGFGGDSKYSAVGSRADASGD